MPVDGVATAREAEDEDVAGITAAREANEDEGVSDVAFQSD